MEAEELYNSEESIADARGKNWCLRCFFDEAPERRNHTSGGLFKKRILDCFTKENPLKIKKFQKNASISYCLTYYK